MVDQKYIDQMIDLLAKGQELSQQKQSEKASKSRKNNKPIRNKETGLTFPNAQAAADWAGIKTAYSITACCEGRQGGSGRHPVTGERMHWEYCTGGDEE